MKLFAFQLIALVFAITVFGHTLNKRQDIVDDVIKSVDESGKECPLNYIIQSAYDDTTDLKDPEIVKKYTEGVTETCKSKLCVQAYITFFEAFIKEIPQETDSVAAYIDSLKKCGGGSNNMDKKNSSTETGSTDAGNAGNSESGASPLVLTSGLFITILTFLYYLM